MLATRSHRDSWSHKLHEILENKNQHHATYIKEQDLVSMGSKDMLFLGDFRGLWRSLLTFDKKR